MPPIRTDDAPRRLRAVWLGPRGHTLTWTWEYRHWAAFGAIWLTLAGVLGALLWQIRPSLGVIGGPMWAIPLAYVASRRVMTFVDYDRPVRYWTRTLRRAWKLTTPVDAAETRVLVTARVPAQDFAPKALRELYLRPEERCSCLAEPRWGWRR